MVTARSGSSVALSAELAARTEKHCLSDQFSGVKVSAASTVTMAGLGVAVTTTSWDGAASSTGQ